MKKPRTSKQLAEKLQSSQGLAEKLADHLAEKIRKNKMRPKPAALRQIIDRLSWASSAIDANAVEAVTPVVPGACCFDGTCHDLTQADCAGAGGSFMGPGTDCAADHIVCAV